MVTERIHTRIRGLEEGSIQRDDLLVFGSRPLLEELQSRGLKLYLASGIARGQRHEHFSDAITASGLLRWNWHRLRARNVAKPH